jgi:hypothetical protein
MGRIPAVFKTAMQINQVICLLRADFHKAINFQTASQTPKISIKGRKE